MSVASNIFVCDVLDDVHALEYSMYVEACKIVDISEVRSQGDLDSCLVKHEVFVDPKSRILGYFYLFVLFGFDTILHKISILGPHQEYVLGVASDILSAGIRLKPDCFSNIVRAMDVFLSYVVHSDQFVHCLARSLTQYLCFVSSSEPSCVGTVGKCICLITKLLTFLTPSAALSPILVFCLGRILCGSVHLQDQYQGVFMDHLNRLESSQKVIGRDLIRTCLELCGHASQLKAVLGRQYFQVQAGLPSDHNQIIFRMPAEFWRCMTFILDSVDVHEMKAYVPMLVEQFGFGEEFYVDAIRALVVCHHPANSIIASGRGQRWLLILHILKLIKNPGNIARAKLAVFLDWFCPSHDHKRDVMHFEPGCLIISKGSMLSELIPVSLLEFLYLSSVHFNPGQAIFDCIHHAFSICIKMEVIKPTDIRLPSSCNARLKEFVSRLTIDRLPADRDAASRSAPKSLVHRVSEERILAALLADLIDLKKSVIK